MLRYVLPMMLLLSGCSMAMHDDSQQKFSAKQRAEMEKTLAGLIPGKPTSCVSVSMVQNIDTYPNTMLFKFNRNRVYRNDLSGGCPGASFGEFPVFQVHGSQYCSGDIVNFRDSSTGMLTGSCALGEFTPYTKSKGA